MTDPNPDRNQAPGAKDPGERRLAHPPSDRYRAAEARAAASAAAVAGPDPAASVARGVTLAIIAAIVGSALIVVVGGILTLTSGLIVVAGVTGGAIGLALRWGAAHRLTRRRRIGIALGIALVAMVAGQVGLWQYGLTEGGVLPLFDYLGQVFGPLVPLEIATAGVVAAVAAA
ncbi:MAG: hypothetical protein H0T59_00460 [Chloroflexi bacterium]|nr:hypothetical protein [Chloroflexota bacterium]